MDRPQPSARGDLAKTPFSHLLIYCLEKKLSGSLELTPPGGRPSVVLLKEGRATKARTAEPVAFLGRVLLELGLAHEDAVNETLLDVAKTKRLHGELLVARGAVDEAKLARGLEVQLRRKLAHLFSLPSETTFAFYAAKDLLDGWGGATPAVAVDPLPVVWRAVAESPPWDHVHATMSRVTNNRIRVASAAQLGRLELEADAAAAAERLRATPMRVSELASLGVASARVTQLLVYVLLVTKLAEVGEAVAASPPPASVRPSVPPPSRRTSTPPRAPMGSSPGGLGPMRPPQSSSPGRTLAPSPPVGGAHALPRPAAVPSFGGTGSYPAAGGAGGKELAPELAARAAEIRERAAGIDKQDYFAMLGVPRSATPDEVKAAFFQLAKRWHPDRLPRELEALRDDCARVFGRLGEAHTTLVDPEGRQRYMRLLAEGGATPDEQEAIAAVLEAATNFQKAEVFLKRNDLAQAEVLCRKAHEADKNQPDYLALLAWIEAQKRENQEQKPTQDRIAMLDRAISTNPNAAKAYFYRAMLHKRLGNDRQAVRDFRKCAELDPRNVDAAREARLYEMRRQRGSTTPPPSARVGPSEQPPAGPRGPGLLGKIFKR